MAFTTGNTSETETITVTNGNQAVSIGVTERFTRTSHVALTPERATDLAIAILNGAANVRAKIHGGDRDVQYTDVARAREALDYDGLPTEDGYYEDDKGQFFERSGGKWYSRMNSTSPFANWEVSLLAHGELHRLGRV